MKRLIALTLALFTLFAFTACSKKTESASTAAAKTNSKAPVIGILQYGEHPSLDNCRKGLLEGLKESGLTEGKDFTVDYQNAGFNDATAAQIAQNFSANNAALMCGIATPAATACYAAAEDKNIPVLFEAVNDPKASKLTGGNITGTSDKLPVEAQLKLIRAIQPKAKMIGIIYTLSESNSVSTIKDYKAKAASYGFTIEAIGVNAQSEVTQAADTLIKKKVDCFSNLTDNNVVGVLDSVLEKTDEAGIPVYGSEIEQVKKGCIASAGIDYYQLGITTGKMAAKLLKGEAKASDIPFVTVTDYKNYVNTKALSSFKLSLPSSLKNSVEEVSASESTTAAKTSK